MSVSAGILLLPGMVFIEKTFCIVYKQDRPSFLMRDLILIYARACLKKAFRELRVPVCGRFYSNEGGVAGYGNRKLVSTFLRFNLFRQIVEIHPAIHFFFQLCFRSFFFPHNFCQLSGIRRIFYHIVVQLFDFLL